MSTKLREISSAVLVVLLCLTFGGSFIEAASYLVVVNVERALEGLGALPLHWNETHGVYLIAASILVIIPAFIYIAVRVYTSTLDVERELNRDN